MIKLQQIKSLLGIFIPFYLGLCLGTGEAQAENLWQLISADKSQSVTSYFTENPSVNVIWRYEDAQWSAAVNPNDQDRLDRLSAASVVYSPISSLQIGTGYWISTTQVENLPVNSTLISEPSTYDVGYHLISGTGESVASFLKRHPEISKIWSWDNSLGRFRVFEQGVFLEYQGMTKLQQLDIQKAYWIKVDFQLYSYSLQNMPVGLTNHAAASTPDGRIYANGGTSSGKITNLMLQYSIPENNWSLAPSSILSRSDHTMVYHNRVLYVWGGKNSAGTPLNSLETFDLESGQWSNLESGGTPRYGHSAIIYNQKIYFWGGITNVAPFLLNSLDIYDINAAEWISGTSGGTPRAQHSAQIIDGQMLIIGGSAGDLDRYNLEADTWQLSTGSKVDRQAFGVGQLGNKIFILGGLDSGLETKRNHLVIESGTRLTSTSKNLEYLRSHHQSIYYEGKLYSFGGQNSFGQELSSLEALVVDTLANQQFNQPAEIKNLRVFGSGSDVSVIFDITDLEGDFNLKLDFEYSLDNGQTWIEALGLANQKTRYLPGINQSKTWNTLTDFGTDQKEVKIRLKINDGQSFTNNFQNSESFLIDNGKPLVTDVNLVSFKTSDIVTLSFDVSDIDQDPLNVKLEYSLDGGLNYFSATKISGSTLGIDSSPKQNQSYSAPSLLSTTTSSYELFLEPVSINEEKFVLLNHDQLQVYDTQGVLVSSTELSENSTFLYAPVVRKDGLIMTVNSNNELLGFYPDSSLVLAVKFESEVIDNLSLDQNENVFVVTANGKLSKLDYDGNLIYSEQVGTKQCSRPVSFEDSVILVCDALQILRISNQTGKIEFRTDLIESSGGVIGHPIINDSGQVLISHKNGDFEIFDSSLKSIIHYSNLEITSMPLLDQNNRVYLANLVGQILTYENGAVKELFSSEYNNLMSLQLMSNSMLLLTSNDGTQGLFNTSGERLIQYHTSDGIIKPLIMKNSIIHLAGTTISFYEGLGVSLLDSSWAREGANNRNSMNVVDPIGNKTLELKSRYELAWHSTEDFMTDEDEVRVRISAADGNGYSNNYGISDLFSVKNGENSTPEIVYLFVKNLNGRVEVITRIDDSDDAQINLYVEYSLDDGIGFKKATMDAESIKNLDTSTEVKFLWNSTLDVNQDISSVVLRISADDGGLGSSNSLTSTKFALYNRNNAPRIDSLDISGERGDLTITVAGIDVEQDLSELTFEFSLDDNEFESISPANLEGSLSNLTSPFTTQIKWFSSNDISNIASSVILRVSASDGKEKGLWKRSSKLAIDNSGNWQSVSITNKRAYVAGTADNDYAYFWGGRINGDYTNILERIDPDTLQINSLRAGGQERIGATVNHVNGKLYLYGGQTKLDNCLGAMCNIPSNHLDVYSVATNSWLNISNETIARSDHSAVDYEDRIYIFGGQGEQGLLNSLICFDPNTNSWISLSSGAEPRYGHTAFVHENRMFIWGGLIESSEGTINSLNSMWSYDFHTDEWLQETPGGTPRAFHSVEIFDGKAYFLGGFKVATLAENFILFEDQNSVLNTLDVFDIDKKNWSVGRPGETKRVTHGSAQIDNKLIHFGGLDQEINELGSVDIYTALSPVTTSTNSIPEVTNFSINNYRGDINLILFIEDHDNDAVDLKFELSLDSGITYERLNDSNLLGTLDGISTPSSVQLTWLSRNDIRENKSSVRIRVTPIDGKSGEPKPTVSRIFEVKNDYSNLPPTAEDISISGIRNDIAIQVDLRDPEFDLLDLTFEYSINGGENWSFTNNISGPKEGLVVPSTQSYIWHSFGCNDSTKCTAKSTDITFSSTQVKIRITPSDQGLRVGKASESNIFSVLNDNRLPYTQIVDISGTKNDVVVRFDSVDQDGDILDYSFQYSLNAGESWTTSTNVIGLSSGTPATELIITWQSLKDIFRDQSRVMVRIIPRDILGDGFANPSTEFSLSNDNWTMGIGLNKSRRGHSATLYDQRIYIWGGMDETGKIINRLDIYDLRTGNWIEGVSGGRARVNHAAIANSGYVYFWGGQDDAGNLNSLDIYDIASSTWLVGATGGNPRRGHTASIFNNKIYYWGGTGFTNVLNTLDVYDIALDSWEIGTPGGRARSEHSSIMDGSKIIFWGGMDSSVIVNTMDIYDIEDDEWTIGVTGGEARSGHTANVFERRMIIWGGSNLGVYNTVDVFDLDSYTWSTGDAGGIASEQHSSVQIDDKILYFGGVGTEGFINTVNIYQDPQRLSQDELPEIHQIQIGDGGAKFNRHYHSSVPYRQKIYVWGGLELQLPLLNSLEIYDSNLDQWEESTPGGTPRTGFVMDVIKGRIIISGGTTQSGQVTNEIDIYNINSNTWDSGSRDGTSRKNHAGITYNGALYLWGGEDQNGSFIDTIDIYESATDNWFKRTGGGRVRSNHCAAQYEGKIFFWGGQNPSDEILNSLDIYDINSNVWVEGPAGGVARKYASCVSFEGKIYFFGGEISSGDISDSVDVFDVDNNTWSELTNNSIFERKHFSATLLDQNLYLWGGVDQNEVLNGQLDIFRMPSSSGSIWSEGPTGGVSRIFHTSVNADGRMISWGGLTEFGATNSVDIVDLKNNSYSTAISGGTSRWDHTSTLYEGRVYHWGGMNGEMELNTMDIFTVPTVGVQWLSGISSGRPKYGHSAEHYQGKIYVLGGQDENEKFLETVDIFDISSQSWSIGTTLPSSRSLFTTVRSGRFFYLIGGLELNGTLSNILVYDTENQTASVKGSILTSRHSHASVIIDGSIYSFGGQAGSGTPLRSGEIYTINTNATTETEKLQVSRYGHSASLVGRKVYIWGGESFDGLQNTLEIYDIDEDSWTLGSSGGTSRKYHTAKVVGDRIFYFGGSTLTSTEVNTVDIYEISTDSWSSGPAGGQPRTFHTSILEEGKIYHMGGSSLGNVLDSMDIFVPEDGGSSLSSSVWRLGQTGGENREKHSSVNYKNKIYHWAGLDHAGMPRNTLTIYDSELQSWSVGQTGGSSRHSHQSFAHEDKLYFHGGSNSQSEILSSIDIYKPEVGQWVKGINGGDARNAHSMVISNGKVYSWGGITSQSGVVNTMDIYDIDTWYKSSAGGDSRADHNAAIYDGKMYVLSGFGNGINRSTVNIYDIDNDVWFNGPINSTPRTGASACIMDSDTVGVQKGIYIWGGIVGLDIINVFEVLNVEEEKFVTGAIGGAKRFFATATCDNDRDKIYLWGGKNASNIATNHLDIYSPKIPGSYSSGTNGGTPRYGHTASYHDGKIYIWGGRIDTTQRVNTMDIYDVATDSWSQGPSGGTPRSDHSAVVFNNKIYFYGGSVLTLEKKLDTLDVFDIVKQEWQEGPESRYIYEGSSTEAQRSGHTAVEWEGKMYVWGGHGHIDNELNSLDVMDLKQWRQGSAGGTARYNHSGIAFDEKIYFWGGTNGVTNLNTMDIYDVRSDSWSIGTKGGEARQGHSAIYDQGKIFFWGGVDVTGSNFLNTIDVYEIASAGWTTGFFGGRSRVNHTAVKLGNEIYHWGGRDGSGLLNSTDIYSVISSENLWQTGLAGGTSRSGHTATLVDNKIYFWGGVGNQNELLNTIDIYDLEKSSWSSGTAGGIARKNHKASVSSGLIYFWGGIDSSGNYLTELDVYDTVNDYWSTGNSGGIERQGHSQISYHGQQFIWGGKNTSGNLNILESYDTQTRNWRKLVTGGRARSGHSEVIRNGKIHFWGGETSSGKLINTMDIAEVGSKYNNSPQITSILMATTPDANGYRDSVTMSLAVTDADMDFISIVFEYSTDDGENWNYIDSNHFNIPITNIKPVPNFNVTWRSLSDLPSQVDSLLIKLTPTDSEAVGTTTTIGPIKLNNGGTWITRNSGPNPKSKMDFIIRNDSQFIVWGGEDSNRQLSNTQEIYNVNTGSWSVGTSGENFAVARAEHTSVIHGSKIYHWGGRLNGQFLNSFAVYDVLFDIWRLEAAESGGIARAAHTVNYIDNKMYVWGGEGDEGFLNSLEYYNFEDEDNRWVTVTSGGTPRRGHSSVYYKNKLYFFGGESGSNQNPVVTDLLEIYDIATGEWTNGLGSGVPLVSHRALVEGDRMWVWGGSKSTGRYSNDLYVYDFKANTWTKGPSGGTARKYHAAASSNGILYFYGGWNGSILNSMDSYSIAR